MEGAMVEHAIENNLTTSEAIPGLSVISMQRMSSCQ